MEVDLQDEGEIVSNKFVKYSGRKNEKDRIGFIYDVYDYPNFGDEPTAEQQKQLDKLEKAAKDGQIEVFEAGGKKKYRKIKVLAAYVHDFHEELKCKVVKIGGSEKLLGPAKPYYAIQVVQYHTDPETGAIRKPLSYTLKGWIVGFDRYKSVQSNDEEYPMLKHDLKITCSDAQFQKLDFQVAKEAAWRLDKKLEAQIADEASKNWETLARLLGREMDEDEIKERLGKGDGGVKVAGTTEELDDLLSSIS
jgi:hypothetical protein